MVDPMSYNMTQKNTLDLIPFVRIVGCQHNTVRYPMISDVQRYKRLHMFVILDIEYVISINLIFLFYIFGLFWGLYLI